MCCAAVHHAVKEVRCCRVVCNVMRAILTGAADLYRRDIIVVVV